MNPLCLLTKGRTFKDMAERPGAYKVLEHGMLPKFTAGRGSPFGPTHSVPHKDESPVIPQAAAAVQAGVIEASQTQNLPVDPANLPQPETKTVKKARARDAWIQFIASSKRLIHRVVYGRRGRPAHGATVQTELALEKVTVLRNDLNEDDLEVVLVERKVGTEEKPLARLSKLEMTGEAWIKLTAPFRKKSSESASSPKEENKPSQEVGASV